MQSHAVLPPQIYNETITDLFNPAATNLAVREDIRKGVYVEGLLEEECSSGEGPNLVWGP